LATSTCDAEPLLDIQVADLHLFSRNECLVKQGTHEELIDLGGRYAELCDLQAASYR
jgi:ABC-type multidrug transport system fused ATPase/permease subunit